MAAGDIDLPLARVLDAAAGTLARSGPARFTGVGIDSRQVRAGSLFFAVKGERFDGHDFAAQAVEAGAGGVVLARGRSAGLDLPASVAAIEVEDTVVALGRLARAHRLAMSGLSVVGIAGSNGKTTTKEMVAAILSADAGERAVLKTEGNLNNHLGVPLTLLRLTPEHRFAVIEMGMSALGELSHLASLGRPDVAVIVSIAVEHLEQLHTLENVARAEAEILEAVSERGWAVVPAREPLLDEHVGRVPAARRLSFGAPADSPSVAVDQITPGPGGLDFRLRLRAAPGVQAHLPLVGAHNAMNAAAAAAAALALDVKAEAIVSGLAQVKPAKHRAQLVTVGDRTVLDDCYNASPLSMRAALDALVGATPRGKRRIAVLGDMLELGPDAPEMHRAIGEYAAARVDQLIALGPLSHHLAAAARAQLGDRVHHTDDPAEAAARALEGGAAGDVILVKASRGMKLERVIDSLRARLEAR